ncbi:MAG: hypothetical protein R3B41_03520 [Candidatus Doudnabacteria bacterium]
MIDTKKPFRVDIVIEAKTARLILSLEESIVGFTYDSESGEKTQLTIQPGEYEIKEVAHPTNPDLKVYRYLSESGEFVFLTTKISSQTDKFFVQTIKESVDLS